MGEAIILIVAILVAVVFLALSSRSEKRKRKARIEASFGEPPTAECELDSVVMYAHHLTKHSNNELRVDAITWNDLGMDHVFKRVNACLSSVGEEYLYNSLHELQFNTDKLLKREKAIARFTDSSADRLAVQMRLSKLGKNNYNGFASLMFNQNIIKIKNTFLYHILAFTPFLCIAAAFFNLAVGLLLLGMSFVANYIVYIRYSNKVEDKASAIGYFASMLHCCSRLLGIKSIADLPVMGDIMKPYEQLKRLGRKMPASAANSRVAVSMGDLSAYPKVMFLTDVRRFNKVVGTIAKHRDAVHALYRALGEVDLSLCIASFRKSLSRYAIPEFHTKNEIEFTEMYHPLINNPVTNTGVVSNDSLITGSNASGKSTFIKALAVNGILAQTIYTCAAKRFTARFSMIMTSMAMRDDLLGGESYFIVEIKSLKRIIDAAKKFPCVFYIDEILRGTNTVERIASSSAVLEHLHELDCLCVAASHDIELTEIMKGRFDNLHFSEQVTDNGVEFDYRLKNGAATTRNAIKLLGFMDFDTGIVEKAQNMAINYDEHRTWQLNFTVYFRGK